MLKGRIDLSLGAYVEEFHQPTEEELKALQIRQQTGGCEDCTRNLNQGHWDVLPPNFGKDVKRVRIFPTGSRYLCKEHQEEYVDTLGRLQ